MREEAKRRAELYQALADGKTLQELSKYRDWIDLKPEISMQALRSEYEFQLRIKPEPKKQCYRVGLYQNTLGNFAPVIMMSEGSEREFEKSSGFVRWLTDRIEYELPEGGHGDV